MRRLCLGLVLFLLSGLALQAQPSDDLLVERDLSQQIPPVPESIQIISFNLHGPPGEHIDQVLDAIQKDQPLSDAHVLLLQEVNRDHAESANRNVGLELARRLKMHYAYAVEMEYQQGGGERGLAILSRFPMQETRRLLLPVEGPGGRRRIALGTTLQLGQARLRLYNLHLETRISSDQRAQQIQAILKDAREFQSLPTVIAGDFNTITSRAVTKMFQVLEGAGFATPLSGDKITFRRAFLVRMVLDWIWGRDVSFEEAAVESKIRVSDHRPLWFKIPLAALSRGSSR